MLEAQQSQRVQRQCSGKQSAGKFGARPLREKRVSSNAATAVAFARSERRGCKLARLGLKDSRVWTAPDITYGDAHKSTGRVGRLQVFFPLSSACQPATAPGSPALQADQPARADAPAASQHVRQA